MHTRAWTKVFFSASIVIIIIISGVNFIVNPYSVFGHELDHAFSQKPHVLSDRMSKFYVVNRLKPQSIMMGTSRIGLFPASQLTPYLEEPVYNFSLVGSTIDEQAAYIQYMAKHHQQLKNVVWSLDFFAFNPTKPIDPAFERGRLDQPLYLNDYLASLFSFKTFSRSFKTFKRNLSDPPKSEDLGQPFTQERIEFNIRYILNQYGTDKTFLASESFKNPSSIDSKIDAIRQTLQLCREHNISCVLYTSPVYYQEIDMIYAMGLGDSFEYWKKELSTLQPYTDFCTYSHLSHDTMQFRDSSHVIGNVGELVFARLFSENSSNIPSDFGILVTPSMVDAHLLHQRKQRQSFSLLENSTKLKKRKK